MRSHFTITILLDYIVNPVVSRSKARRNQGQDALFPLFTARPSATPNSESKNRSAVPDLPQRYSKGTKEESVGKLEDSVTLFPLSE